jgi:hypothetical protein
MAPEPAAAPPAPGNRPSRAFVPAALVLLLAALGAGFVLHGDYLYQDVDGAMAVALIRNAPGWTSPWRLSQISHLQGMGGQLLPGLPWLDPGYAVLFLGTTLPFVLGSYLFFAASLFLAAWALGRALGIPTALAAGAAQAAVFALFPPLDFITGMNHQLRMNPGVIYYDVLALLMLAVLLRAGPGATRRGVAAAAVALPALLVYSLLCDPIWTVVPAISLAVFFPAALLADGSRPALVRRGAAALAAVAVALALRLPFYLRDLLAYTARQRFPSEIVGEVQNRFYAFLPALDARSEAAFLVLVAGVLLAFLSRERRVRIFAAAACAHLALMLGLSLVFLYTDVNWTAPLPVYLQLPALPLYFLLAAAGWHALGARLLARWHPGACAPPLLRRPAVAAALVPAAAAVALLAGLPGAPAKASGLGRQYLHQSASPLVRAVRGTLARRPGEPFAGSAVLFSPDQDERSRDQLQVELWAMGVPTLEEYSQLVSPPLYYLATRALGLPEDVAPGRNRVWVTNPRSGLLRALGVRYVFSTRAGAAALRNQPGAQLVFAEENPDMQVFELQRPNLGDWSPTRPAVSRSAWDTAAIIASPGVNLEEAVVLAEPVAGPLTRARAAALRFVDGGVRVTARSDGRSLLLLPLQFSNALTARCDRGAATLLRANLVQTALLFDREVDAFITLDFGFFTTAGRARDLRDLDDLRIGEDGTRRLNPEDVKGLHPDARFHVGRRRPARP